MAYSPAVNCRGDPFIKSRKNPIISIHLKTKPTIFSGKLNHPIY